MSTMNYDAVIVAAGRGERAGLSYNKVMKRIAGRTLVEHVINAFKEDPECARVILVVSQKDEAIMNARFSPLVDCVIIGGKSRRKSVYNGLKGVRSPYVFIHDAARPFVSKKVLDSLKNSLRNHDAISPGLVVPDTLKKVENGIITDSVERTGVYGLQTPQAFLTHVLKEAHTIAEEEALEATCDLSLVTRVFGIKGMVIEGDPRALKYTHERDFKLLELILNDSHRT